jgi:hypothetical protein
MTAVPAKGITRGAQADDASVGRLAAPRATDWSWVSRLRRQGTIRSPGHQFMMAGAICRNAAQGRRSLPENDGQHLAKGHTRPRC